MAAIVDRAINLVRDAMLTPEQQAQRDRQIEQLEMIKTASVATMIVAPIFLLLIPKIFMLILASLAVIGAREVFIASGNVLEMIKTARIYIQAVRTRETLLDQISKNTLFVKQIINMSNPSHEDLIRRIDSLGI
ncbi:MAG: hypothetical protein K1X28_00555 [Parachlamydiales bacterium]|nr:hypothetical protein [Parachlamydiales bacterium]